MVVARLLVALQVYVPSLLFWTLAKVRPPLSSRVSPLLPPSIRAAPLKYQVKERVGSGRVSQGIVKG